MDAGVVKAVVKGFGANAYSQVVTVIVQLVGVPILLHSWGPELYGEWLVLFAMPAVLSMTDLGFFQSAANDMAAHVRRGDNNKALKVFQSLGALIYSLSVLGCILVFVLVWHIPLGELLHFEAIDDDTSQWILYLFSFEIFVRLMGALPYAGLRATGDYALSMALDANIRLIQYMGVCVVAITGGGVLGAAKAFFLIRALSILPLIILFKRRHPWLHLGIAHASREELQRLYKPAIANMATPLAQAINIQGLVIVVGSILGPISVVVFSTLRTLARLVIQLVYAVSHAVEPELAASFGSGDRVLTQSLIVHSLRFSFWFAVVVASFLGLFGAHILKIWTHGNVAMDYTLFFCLLASGVLSTMWYGLFTAQKAANRHLHSSAVLVVASLGSLIIALMVMQLTGAVSGAGLSLLMIDGVMIFYVVKSTAGHFGFSMYACLMQAVNPIPLLAAISRGQKKHQ